MCKHALTRTHDCPCFLLFLPSVLSLPPTHHPHPQHTQNTNHSFIINKRKVVI